MNGYTCPFTGKICRENCRLNNEFGGCEFLGAMHNLSRIAESVRSTTNAVIDIEHSIGGNDGKETVV
jgi:hypothetical protein